MGGGFGVKIPIQDSMTSDYVIQRKLLDDEK